MSPIDTKTPSSSSSDPILNRTDRRPSSGSTHSALPIPSSALLSPDDHSSHPRGKHGAIHNLNGGTAKDRDTASDSHSIRSFFRSASSRPPSPTPLTDQTEPSGYRAIPPSSSTTFSNNTPTPTTANSFGTHSSINATLHSNNSSAYFQSNASSNNGNTYQRPAPHPFSPSTTRRLSADASSRSPSPDHYQQQQPPLPGGKHLFPTTPPAPRGMHQPYKRTESIQSVTETSHRRTKSTDFGDMYFKRPGLPQDLVADLQTTTVASPAKEAKKTLFSLFKKRPHHPSSSPTPPVPSSSSSNYPPSEGIVFSSSKWLLGDIIDSYRCQLHFLRSIYLSCCKARTAY